MYIVDTNALIYAVKQHIDLNKFLDGEILIPSSVLLELEKLSNENTYAKLAMVLASRMKVIYTDKKGDDGIIDSALKVHGIVVTNDAELKKRLAASGVRTFSITEGRVRL